MHTLRGHNDEILDVSFNATGSKLVTASADGTSRVFNTMTGACQAILIGHEGEISKVCLSELNQIACTLQRETRALHTLGLRLEHFGCCGCCYSACCLFT